MSQASYHLFHIVASHTCTISRKVGKLEMTERIIMLSSILPVVRTLLTRIQAYKCATQPAMTNESLVGHIKKPPQNVMVFYKLIVVYRR